MKLPEFNLQKLKERPWLIVAGLFLLGVFIGLLIWVSAAPLKKQYKMPDFPTTTVEPKTPPKSAPPAAKTSFQTIYVSMDNAPLHTAANSNSKVIRRLPAKTPLKVLETKVVALSSQEHSPTEATVAKDKLAIIRAQAYKLKRGQTVEIIAFDGKKYQVRVKFAKAGWQEMNLAPEEIVFRKTYDWYKVNTPNLTEGWIYGAYAR